MDGLFQYTVILVIKFQLFSCVTSSLFQIESSADFDDSISSFASINKEDYGQMMMDYVSYNIPAANLTLNISDVTVLDPCLAFLFAFGDEASSFIRCVVRHAKPVRFCEGCVTHYERVLSLYSDILQNDETKQGCRLILLESDRIEVLSKTHDYIEGLWSSADCPNCFDNITEYTNGTVKFILDNSTGEFLEKFNITMECFQNNTQDPSQFGSIQQGNHTVCKNCAQQYKRLNQLFDTLLGETDFHVCMDIVDIMNYTRYLWSNKYGCSSRSGDITPIIILTIVFALCPVVFYTGNRIHGVAREANIVKQKRLQTPDEFTRLNQPNDITHIPCNYGATNSNYVATHSADVHPDIMSQSINSV